MPQLITQNAQLQCNLGSAPSQLLVTSQNFVKADGKLVATENDKTPITNIQLFGTCKKGSFPPPCSPAPQAWQQTTQKDNINGMRKLTEDSFCMCSQGGKITITDIGHSENHSAE